MSKISIATISFLVFINVYLPGRTTAKEIMIGSLFVTSGPTASLGKDYRMGCFAASEYFNQNGGANGSSVKILDSDTLYQKKKILSYYKKYRKKGIFAILGWGTSGTHLLKENVQKDKIIFMSQSYDGLLTNPRLTPFSFFVASSYSDQIRAAIQFAKEKGAQKIAFIYPKMPFGEVPITAGKDFAKALGLKISPDIPHNPGRRIQASNIIKKCQNFDPDFAWLGGASNHVPSILSAAAKLKIRTKFIINCWGIDEIVAKKISKNMRPLVFGMMPVVPFREEVPGAELMRSVVMKKDASERTVHFTKGWLTTMVLCEGIKRAQKAGNLSGPGLKEALESIKDFDTGGLTPENLSYSAKDHRPITTTYIYSIQKDRLTKVKAIHIERKKEYLGW